MKSEKYIVDNSIFFRGVVHGVTLNSQYLKDKKIDSIKFSIRFLNAIKTYNQGSINKIQNLEDLLNIDRTAFLLLLNCGLRSLNDACSAIRYFLSNSDISETNNFGQKPSSTPTSDIIIQNSLLDKCRIFSGDYGMHIISDVINCIDLTKFKMDLNPEIRLLLNNSTVNHLASLLNEDSQKIGIKNNNDLVNLRVDLFGFLKYIDIQLEKLISSLQPSELPFLKNFVIKKSWLLQTRCIEIFEVNFPEDFQSFVYHKLKIRTVDGLLNINYQSIKGINKETITKSQEILFDFIKNPIKIIYNTPIDVRIKNYLRSLSKDQRNYLILLQYFSYFSEKKATYHEIGIELGLTRERVRQICDKIIRAMHLKRGEIKIFDNALKEYGYVIRLDRLLDVLKDERLWTSTNKFFYNTIEYLISADYCLVFNEYLVDKSMQELDYAFGNLEKMIIDKLTSNEDGLIIAELIQTLKAEMNKYKIDPNKLLKIDTLEYLSIKTKRFFVVNNLIYNEMMYNVFFGKSLNKIVYWSLKYLNEPIHFTQLAKFIRENNVKHNDVKDNTVHSTLMRLDYCHDVDRGTYALKEANIPKHISAGGAIINLIRKNKGPLLEEQIFKMLKNEYSSWNIKMALANNKHRFIKIGNNLYDLREERHEEY